MFVVTWSQKDALNSDRQWKSTMDAVEESLYCACLQAFTRDIKINLCLTFCDEEELKLLPPRRRSSLQAGKMFCLAVWSTTSVPRFRRLAVVCVFARISSFLLSFLLCGYLLRERLSKVIRNAHKRRGSLWNKTGSRYSPRCKWRMASHFLQWISYTFHPCEQKLWATTHDAKYRLFVSIW